MATQSRLLCSCRNANQQQNVQPKSCTRNVWGNLLVASVAKSSISSRPQSRGGLFSHRRKSGEGNFAAGNCILKWDSSCLSTGYLFNFSFFFELQCQVREALIFCRKKKNPKTLKNPAMPWNIQALHLNKGGTSARKQVKEQGKDFPWKWVEIRTQISVKSSSGILVFDQNLSVSNFYKPEASEVDFMPSLVPHLIPSDTGIWSISWSLCLEWASPEAEKELRQMKTLQLLLFKKCFWSPAAVV